MIIKNIDYLANTRHRRIVLEIIEAGISRALPSAVMQSALKYDRSQRILNVCGEAYQIGEGRVFVIGGGKASGLMAEALTDILGNEIITAGIVTCKDAHPLNSPIKVLPAGHPLPDQRGVNGVKEILRLKEQYNINRSDLILCLISGGGSALMPYPSDDITLEDKQKITGLLLASGAEIGEINTVRKHLSQVKGGRLGQYFAPATVVSLILSDVIGNDLGSIASGPTVPDSSTFAGAYRILEKYHLSGRTSPSILDHLRKGCDGHVEETPKELSNCHNYIIGDNILALQAMAGRARELGLRPEIITAEQKGDTSDVARSRALEMRQVDHMAHNLFLVGGETTLQLPAKCGMGGRNQHYTAVSCLEMADYTGEWVIASVGTDGSDYLPNVAGAIADNNTWASARKNNIDLQSYITNCDSYNLFMKLGNSLIETGNTGTNVGDVMVYYYPVQG